MPEDCLKSSTFREVSVFLNFFMQSNLEPFKNSSILHYTDSKAAEHIITFGSRNPEIQSMVFYIMLKARAFGISISARWISREDEEMKLADSGSRGPWFPAQEISLKEPIMAMIKANFNLTLDLFASFKNRVTLRYFSAA